MQRTAGLGLVLFVFFTGLYLLTYRGHPVSTDEMILFDMTESLARRGNLQPSEMYNLTTLTNPTSDPFRPPDDQYEPIQALVAAPLFWIAQHISRFGSMHTVWFLNIPVTALTVTLLYVIALRRGYSVAVAGLGAFLYGGATLAWVYSRFFWREPLTALFLLAGFGIALEIQSRWRQNKNALKLAPLLILIFLAGFLSKASIILALPGLLIVALPPSTSTLTKNRALLRQLVIIALVAGLLTVAFLSLDLGSGENRYSLTRWQELIQEPDWGYIAESVVGYHLSPGRSIWLYSPILLLGLAGALLLWRRKERHLVLAIFITLVIFTFSYGLSRRALWWGGNSWGPRYLLPMIPVMMLLVLPVLEQLLKKGCRKEWRAAAALLAVLSIGTQFLGITVYTWDYYDLLAENQILPWEEGLWSIEWSPIVQHLSLWQADQLDMAWRYASPNWQAPLLALSLIGSSAVFAIWMARRPTVNRGLMAILTAIAIVGMLGTAYSWLITLQEDERYTLNRADIQAMIVYLQEHSDAEDVVFLENSDYQLPFMNELKSPGLFMTLPYAPGEIRNPNVPPEVISTDAGVQAGYFAVYPMKWAAERYDRLWLIMSYGPFLEFALRPQERWLVDNYFWVETIETSPTVRAIRFDPTPTPTGAPATIEPHNFNNELFLIGYDLPDGAVYQQGEVIPVSLLWQPFHPITEDYFVSVRLLKDDGFLVAQQDGLPQASFGHTSHWIPEQFYRDNHGIQIPQYTTPGLYRIEVVLYRWPSNARLPVYEETATTDVVQLTTIEIR